MTGALFFFHFWDPGPDQEYMRYPWVIVIAGLIFVWGFLALFHGFNAFMNWLERRKDVSFDD